MNGIASGSYIHTNAIIGNHNGNTAKSKAFYKTHSSLGLLITYNGSYVSVAHDKSTFTLPDYRFPSPKSNCTILNKWHVISVTWSNRKNLSNCWSNGEKLMTFNTGIIEGSNHCFFGDQGTIMKIRSMQTCIMSSLPRCIFRCSVFRYVTLVSFFSLFFCSNFVI